jgi:hypothetical protein
MKAEKRRVEEAAAHAKRAAPLEPRSIDPALVAELEQRQREIEASLYLIETAEGGRMWVSQAVIDYRQKHNIPVGVLREPTCAPE